jgi:hypothetical protein
MPSEGGNREFYPPVLKPFWPPRIHTPPHLNCWGNLPFAHLAYCSSVGYDAIYPANIDLVSHSAMRPAMLDTFLMSKDSAKQHAE